VSRGTLRVYLGSAPGVGKTYRMLDEGWRRRQRGTDVVIGYVETHDRPLTEAQLRDLEVVPRQVREYRGARLSEMDLDAVLARRPQVVLVDELAHTNVPGGVHEKRWQDVETLLDAGIDVITTVNIQHLESVNDVVEAITGIVQQETVPDAFVRRAEQVELVDVTPEALRRRMAHGNIYPAERIDASLANYFRVGNLGALRELALLWLADRVDEALTRYREEHEIERAWETRERLVVGLAGGATDEGLLRRAARMAARAGAELVAVHVVGGDAESTRAIDAGPMRELTEELGGRFREIVDDDVAGALVAFARDERATQVVVSAGHGRSWRRPRGGVVEKLVTLSRDLDVHVIAPHRSDDSSAAAARARSRTRAGTIPARRWVGAAVGALVLLPALTAGFAAVRASVSLSTVYLAYLVVVLALASVGGVVVGAVTALAATTLENYYFIPPVHTFSVNHVDDVVSLVGFLAFAIVGSTLTTSVVRRSAQAGRARAEARVLSQATLAVGTSIDVLEPLLASLLDALGASGVALVTTGDGAPRVATSVGDPISDFAAAEVVPVDADHELALAGVDLSGDDRNLVVAFAGRIAVGLAVVDTARVAERAQEQLAHESRRADLVEAVRGALARDCALARHELDAALDGAKDAPPRVQRERLERIRRALDGLERLGRELDAADALEHPGPVIFERVTLVDLVSEATQDFSGDERLTVDAQPDVEARTDRRVVTRALATLARSALEASGPGDKVRVSAVRAGAWAEFAVVDRARRAPSEDAVGRYLVESLAAQVAGECRFEDTPGGGRTAVLEVPIEGRPVVARSLDASAPADHRGPGAPA
jgi:two-component system, OmpR family, sensor histidine kinase KdpD